MLAKRSFDCLASARITTALMPPETCGFTFDGGIGVSLTWQTIRRPSVSPMNGCRPVSAS